MGTESFPWLKRPERGADHPHERVELYLYLPSVSQWPVIGRTLPLPGTHTHAHTYMCIYIYIYTLTHMYVLVHLCVCVATVNNKVAEN